MALANDMSALINKIERRLGLLLLTPHLPKELNKESWAEEINTNTLVTFSRYFPNRLRFVVNNDTCYTSRENGRLYYYIKDEYLQGIKLLGVQDIDWTDMSADNLSMNQTAGYGYYIPNYAGLDATYEAFISNQITANIASLYNNGIFLDFTYPNKISLTKAGNLDVKLDKFVVNLLVQHHNIATISPTKMETFESLAQADIARLLFMNLRYVDGLESVYLTLDLKLNELEQEANRRQEIIDELKQSYVSASNDNIPYIMSING